MVAELLKHGEKNAISTPELIQALGLEDTRALRLMVARERKNGAVIISSHQGGYFLPEDKAEVERFIRTESRKAISSLVMLKSAKDFLKAIDQGNSGQLALDIEGS